MKSLCLSNLLRTLICFTAFGWCIAIHTTCGSISSNYLGTTFSVTGVSGAAPSVRSRQTGALASRVAATWRPRQCLVGPVAAQDWPVACLAWGRGEVTRGQRAVRRDIWRLALVL